MTISAPLASTAARVSSKSLYFPVPTRSREEYAFARDDEIIHYPFPLLSAAHRHHDFKPVPICENRLIEPAARDDFSIALDRNTLALQPHVFQ